MSRPDLPALGHEFVRPLAVGDVSREELLHVRDSIQHLRPKKRWKKDIRFDQYLAQLFCHCERRLNRTSVLVHGFTEKLDWFVIDKLWFQSPAYVVQLNGKPQFVVLDQIDTLMIYWRHWLSNLVSDLQRSKSDSDPRLRLVDGRLWGEHFWRHCLNWDQAQARVARGQGGEPGTSHRPLPQMSQAIRQTGPRTIGRVFRFELNF